MRYVTVTERCDKTKWCIPVTTALDDAVEHAVAKDSHISKSEFVRDAVRKQLESMGFNPQVFGEKKIKSEA
jgi:Arc/MetJ-type ribon-helix-helix transcriptional regulator